MSYKIIEIKKEVFTKIFSEIPSLSQVIANIKIIDLKILVPSIQVDNNAIKIRFLSSVAEKLAIIDHKMDDIDKIDSIKPELYNIYNYDSLVSLTDDDRNPKNIYIDIKDVAGVNKFFIPESSFNDGTAFLMEEKYLLYVYLASEYTNYKKK